MFKMRVGLSLTRKNALKAPVIIYRYCAYKTYEDHLKGEYYITKDFLSLEDLLVFNTELEEIDRKVYKDFCSDYFLIEVKPKHLKLC